MEEGCPCRGGAAVCLEDVAAQGALTVTPAGTEGTDGPLVSSFTVVTAGPHDFFAVRE